VDEDPITSLAAHKFVLLSTFKKNGDAVATPMWVGRDGDHLFVWTPADSWKVKRVRNNPRVRLVPCGRFGKPHKGAHSFEGTAEVITEPAVVQRLTEVMRRKYGLQFHVVTFIERLVARGQKSRYILRIAVSR